MFIGIYDLGVTRASSTTFVRCALAVLQDLGGFLTFLAFWVKDRHYSVEWYHKEFRFNIYSIYISVCLCRLSRNLQLHFHFASFPNACFCFENVFRLILPHSLFFCTSSGGCFKFLRFFEIALGIS